MHRCDLRIVQKGRFAQCSKTISIKGVECVEHACGQQALLDEIRLGSSQLREADLTTRVA
ncbi:hypothetical protein ADL19_27860 [Streptomyces purpurogeneiscleroticus]|nr:hypothetical protein ADL19_27860 [Streptomyces purpurogeneiscleroticus]